MRSHTLGTICAAVLAASLSSACSGDVEADIAEETIVDVLPSGDGLSPGLGNKPTTQQPPLETESTEPDEPEEANSSDAPDDGRPARSDVEAGLRILLEDELALGIGPVADSLLNEYCACVTDHVYSEMSPDGLTALSESNRDAVFDREDSDLFTLATSTCITGLVNNSP